MEIAYLYIMLIESVLIQQLFQFIAKKLHF